MNTSDESCEFLDVSEFAAPEPLQLALEAIQRIAPGKFLYLQHRKYPRLLYERLRQRGYESDTRRGPGGCCKVFIWLARDELARTRVTPIASQYDSWHDLA